MSVNNYCWLLRKKKLTKLIFKSIKRKINVAFLGNQFLFFKNTAEKIKSGMQFRELGQIVTFLVLTKTTFRLDFFTVLRTKHSFLPTKPYTTTPQVICLNRYLPVPPAVC